jgi:hypothetical protein
MELINQLVVLMARRKKDIKRRKEENVQLSAMK